MLPPGSTDCHAHVLRADVPSPVPGARYQAFDAPVHRYLATLAELGLDRGVLVTASTYGTDNSVLVEALRTAPDRLRGVAVVPPDCDADTPVALHEAGVRACRVQDLFPGGVDVRCLPEVATRVASLGWHIEVWTDLRRHLDWLPRVVAQTGVPVVVDHFGFLPPDIGVGEAPFRELLAMARDGAAWVTLSGAYRLLPGATEAEAADALQARVDALCDAVPGQLLWGSDWPHVAPPGPVPTHAELRAGLEQWLPDAELRQQVLVDNPARRYGFSGGEF